MLGGRTLQQAPDFTTPQDCWVRAAAKLQLPHPDVWLSSHRGCQRHLRPHALPELVPAQHPESSCCHPFPDVLTCAKRENLAEILTQGKACLEDQRIQP